VGILDQIGPRLFRLPKDVLEDEEMAWDKVTFIIECLSLYRLLLLKQDDIVLFRTFLTCADLRLE
jgi:hypothetical protein